MQSTQGFSAVRDWWDIGAAIVVGIASAAFTYARITTKLNGVGRRLRDVETEQSKQDERMHAIEHEQGRAQEDRQRLHEQVGAAVRAAEASQEASEQARLAIVGAVHEFQLAIVKEMGQFRTDIGERMASVETKVDLLKPRRPQ